MSSTLSQEDVDIQAPPPAANVLLEDGDLITPLCTTFQDSQKPAKKQTRQWAAWTRQEEEKFFHALRQVGKNFEKITCRVQSKNKDQVRHYYYRLVRRMNKLLGPGLCLDAKNSKDTVAAMLRWWSLLEKFSCSASKLHLRPRRFKILLETLENQLHKDRKKTRRKRPSQGEGCLTTSSSTSLISKAPTNDARPVKLLVVDSQTSHKIGANKGTSLRRNVGPSVSFNKGDLSTTKTVRQKRRGVASSAYRRWEKAAMDGVSLVADAAELLEQEANDGQSGTGSVGKTADGFPSHGLIETALQPSLKLKLQLFPIDEGTRKALEKDAHNPHLELTLSARKRISSVLEHLNRKWGNSAIATGQQLMLVPYTLHQEDLASHQRWTARDTDATAADVYGTVGTPSIFRLRYGWFSGSEIGSGIVHVPSPTPDFENGMLHAEDIQEGGRAKDVPTTEAIAFDSMEHAKSANHISDAVESSKNESTSGLSRVRPVTDMSEPIMHGGCSSAGEWADSLTTISVGDLLSEASKAAAVDYCYSSAVPGRQLEQIPFSCDSFDAAIAAHVSRHQSTEAISHASIWNAEETCDEFSFRKIPAFKGTDSNPFGVSIGACTDSLGLSSYLKDLPESGPLEDRQDPAENVYWQDSLGFFEVDMPRDLILGESISLGGLSHLIASSVDAFQNCSFFGAGEARG